MLKRGLAYETFYDVYGENNNDPSKSTWNDETKCVFIFKVYFRLFVEKNKKYMT